MNQCTFLGRLTRDPEIRYAKESQMPIARFHIAVDRRKAGESEPNADFFSCVVFDRRAEFAEQYLRSGMRILISGSMQNNNYTNKAGEKVYGMELIGNVIEFADGKREQEGEASQNASGSASSRKGNTGRASASGTGTRAPGRTASGTGTAGPSVQNQRTAGTGTRAGGNVPVSGNQPGGGRTEATARAAGSRTGATGTASRSVSGRASTARPASRTASASYDGFLNIPDGVEDEGLPFN